MSLTKEITTDRIQIINNTDMDGTPITLVSVRQQVKILENGSLLSSKYNRYMITEGQDYSAEDTQVRAVCDIAFA
jgi:hypothetical protein